MAECMLCKQSCGEVCRECWSRVNNDNKWLKRNHELHLKEIDNKLAQLRTEELKLQMLNGELGLVVVEQASRCDKLQADIADLQERNKKLEEGLMDTGDWPGGMDFVYVLDSLALTIDLKGYGATSKWLLWKAKQLQALIAEDKKK